MTDPMEWIIIFFMLYTFLSVWVITNMLEKILKVLGEKGRE
jgi:small neutral amino acid transporter SnatA (MarC family)